MKQVFAGLAASSRNVAGDRETEARRKLLELWSLDPWEWLTGQDLGGRPIIWTRDERDDDAPVKPFPSDKAYLKRIAEAAFEPEPLFIDKARQMMISTLLTLLADWYCRFRLARNVLISKQKEGEAEKLIREKLRSVDTRLPQWVREELPISVAPANRVEYLKTGSFVHGVAQNFALAEARGSTASIVFIDEAGYQAYTGDIISAVGPMAARLWATTTANIANPGGRVFKSIIEEV